MSDGQQFGIQIQYSSEVTALETAGGICKALPLLAPTDYFLVINGDVFSPHLPIAQILQTASQFSTQSNQPLAHLLMVPNPIQHRDGDFYLNGLAISDQESTGAEKLTFSGIGIYHKALFKDLKIGSPAKLAPILRQAMGENRVSGEKYLGPWHDVGTPQRLQELNAVYE